MNEETAGPAEETRDPEETQEQDPEQDPEEESSGKTLQRYVDTLREHQRVQRVAKAVKDDLDRQSEDVIRILRTLGIDSLTMSGGDNVSVKEGVKAQMISTEEGEYAKLRELSWAEGLVKEYVHPQSLSARVRETVERDGELPPEIRELVQWERTESVSVTKDTPDRGGRRRR